MYKKLLFISALLIFLCGCGIYRAPMPLADYYYFNPDKNLADIGKVALIQLNNNSNYTEISEDATKSLYEELQKKQVFSLRVVPENDPAWRSLQIDLDSSYTIEQLVTIRKALRCDAVIFGTVTEYTPYPHMIIGLRLKMVGLDDGQLIWAFEQVWDTTDKKTEYRIRKYLQNQTNTGATNLSERLVTISSIKFLKFVAYEVAQTL